MQIRYTSTTGATVSKSIDSSGILIDDDCTIRCDYDQGVIHARFGRYVLTGALTNEDKLKPFYNQDLNIILDGNIYTWYPKPVKSKTIFYNAVAQTFLPPDSAMLGINAARLPPDGKALIFNTGRLVLVHHTASLAESSLSPTQVINCGRTRLYRVEIEDANGKRLNKSQFDLDRAAGMVTMSPSLDLTGFSAPYSIKHTVADLSRVVKTDINGTLSLQKAMSHTYPADESRVSGVLFVGVMQARYTGLFAQSSWTGVWQDTLSGSEPLAQYNDALYPIIVSNAGAYTDRVVVKFTGSTSFQVFGENLGYLGEGSTSTNFSAINSRTGQTYFTIDHRGWGSGWATGNCLRFNLIGAVFPIDLIRSVQPSDPMGLSYDVELLLIGNVDA
ncbi:hypothetical protein CCP4SC76_2310002 [Gammaproteobacteria bacterium]